MIYGRDARLPTEAALSILPTLQMLEDGDYKAKLVSGLAECWHLAHTSITKAQAQQKECYDCYAKEPKIQTSDRVMVFMPQEASSTLPWSILRT